MWLSWVAGSLNRVVRPVSRVIHSVGMSVLAAMVFLTFADVSLRYAFNRPIPGTLGITEYMMVIIISLCIPYCALVKGNVRVDLVVSRFRKRSQVIIGVITGLLGLGLYSLMAWQCFLNIKEQFVVGLVSMVLRIPVFPFAAVVTFGIAVLCLVLLIDFLDLLSQEVRK